MRGSTLINGVRENVGKYPNLCKMNIYLYDDEDREQSGDDAVFVTDLFANNAVSRAQFIQTLDKLETNAPAFMNVKVTASHVVLLYKTPCAKVFSRTEVIDPADCDD